MSYALYQEVYMPGDMYVTLEMSRSHDVSASVNPIVNSALYCTKKFEGNS